MKKCIATIKEKMRLSNRDREETCVNPSPPFVIHQMVLDIEPKVFENIFGVFLLG